LDDFKTPRPPPPMQQPPTLSKQTPYTQNNSESPVV
jgi:hypothetical protein